MIIAGDIGGTKTVIGLYRREAGKLALEEQLIYPSREHGGLDEILAKVAQIVSLDNITDACFGIAGPVVDGRCRTTNLPWEVDARELASTLDVPKVWLLNDLEATAYGMLHLPESDLLELNPTARIRKGNIAVVAAGTGLGEAMLYWDGNAYHPIGTEGGHTDFAPATPQQDQLLVWLRTRFPGHVSMERMLSGPGVYTLYQFLRDSSFAPEPFAMQNLSDGDDPSATISLCAQRDHDPLCVETLRLFVEIYGGEAGNMALKTLSVGGVFIGGGIAPKILPYLKTGEFLNAFAAKGRFEELMRGMSLKVSLNPITALIGAAHYAEHHANP